MKKFLMFAGILAFMSCSTDNSDTPVDPVIPIKDIVGRLLFTSYDYDKKETGLYIYKPATEELTLVQSFSYSKYPNLQEFGLDDDSKMLYSVTLDNHKLLSYNYEKKQEISYANLVSNNINELHGAGLSNNGKLISFDFDKVGSGMTNAFISIDVKTGVVKRETESVEMNKLTNKGNSDYLAIDKAKNEMSSLIDTYGDKYQRESLVIATVGIDNFKEFDKSTKDKVISIDLSQIGDRFESRGLVKDKNGVFYIAYVNDKTSDKSIIAAVDSKDGTLKEVFKTGFIYTMSYDINSNSIFMLGERETDHKMVFVQYNLSTKALKQTVIGVEGEVMSAAVIK